MRSWKWCVPLVFFASFFRAIRAQLENPCPHIFEYALDENQRLFGRIRLDNPTGNNIVLNVELSVGNSVQDYNGNIELAYGRARAVDEIIGGRPLHYKVFFPFWKVFPPRITKILVNGDLICSGPPLDIAMQAIAQLSPKAAQYTNLSFKRVPILTTINLQHSLKISSLSLASPDENYRPVKPPNRYPNGNNIEYQNQGFNQPAKDGNDNVYVHIIDPSGSQQYPNNPFFPQTNANKPQTGSPFFDVSNTDGKEKPRPRPERPQDGGSYYQSVPNFQHNPFLYPNKPEEKPSQPTPQPTPRPTPQPVPQPDELPDIDVRGNTNEICGRSLSTNSLIANGQPVIKGYYPWLVALYNIKQLNLEFTCGGSLVSKKHIVTAAHCMRPYERKINIEQLLVILGKYNIQRWTNDNSVMLGAKKVSVHPDYRALSADADVAVITLSDEVKFKSFIRPICLWSGDDDLKAIVGDTGIVAGWGKDENGETLTPEPKQVTLPVVSQVECLRSHDDFADITSNRTFCAGFRNGSGPCNGDSGGGFMMLRGGKWTLRGVVSMSIADQGRRCDLGQYLVFTDVSKFSDWILAIVKQ